MKKKKTRMIRFKDRYRDAQPICTFLYLYGLIVVVFKGFVFTSERKLNQTRKQALEFCHST